MRDGRSAWLVLVACTILMPSRAAAQSATTGAIAGEVKDTTGLVLPGATVEAASPALIEKVRTVVTDGKGQYKIVELRPGTYTVTISLAGFNTVKRESLELTTGFTATVNAELRVGAIEETISVSAGVPMVDVQNVRSQNVISREVLDTLPTGKALFGYATLTLGATTAGAGGLQDVGGNKGDQPVALQIHGIHQTDQKLLWDGMPFNQSGAGGGINSNYKINTMAVQETVLQTGGVLSEGESGGIQVNVVPKDGGNMFSGMFFGSGSGSALQGKNLSDALRARGLVNGQANKELYDVGMGIGGPLKKDTIWFYLPTRVWGSQEYATGNYFNKTQNTLFYTPDLDRPAYTDTYQRDHSIRLTWQASAKNRFSVSESYQNNCLCYRLLDSVNAAPEAVVSAHYEPTNVALATWTYPATNRLLLQAGALFMKSTSHRDFNEVGPGNIPVTEQSTGYSYGAPSGITYYPRWESDQQNQRFMISYVTGSHAFKTGVVTSQGMQSQTQQGIPVSYAFLNRAPRQITQWATPSSNKATYRTLALYAQDQWTIQRMTLNLGLRYDSIDATLPAQTRPAGQFVPSFSFDQRNGVPSWKDINPRLGVAYDLFGNGRTALKTSFGRYVDVEATGTALAVNPALAIVTSATRTWNDANGNYVPDCVLSNTALNGECGPLSANGFGTIRVANTYDPELLDGWGVRGYSWQFSGLLQHELRPGLGLTVGYYRTWYGNFRVTDNRGVTPADFSPYCITSPVDPRLPNGGGERVCGLFDIVPSKFGVTDNLITAAKNFGDQSEVYNGVDIAISARFGKGGLFSGGISAGETVTDNCGVAIDSPQALRFCDKTNPFQGASAINQLYPGVQTQIKFNVVYPITWGVQLAATFQNLPGIPVQANYLASNAEILPTLGRNLGQCGAAAVCNATVSIPLVEPGSMFEDRLTQFDLRFSKNVRFGRLRVQPMLDLYNVFNASTILTELPTYSTTNSFLRPTSILAARFIKLGLQVTF